MSLDGGQQAVVKVRNSSVNSSHYMSEYSLVFGGK